MQLDSGESYKVKPKTMKITEDKLVVQVENPVDFVSLMHHKVDLTSYLLHQKLDAYFGMLNGPTCEALVKYFRVRAEIFDKDATKLEEVEKILIDPSLEGETRAEMVLKEFTRTKGKPKESQDNNRKFIPYGRLLLEIFYQGDLLKALKDSNVVADEHLGTVVGKYISGYTLRSMCIIKEVDQLKSDLKESMIVSDLMTDFPPISKEDPPEVLVAYVTTHHEKTGEIINYSTIPYTMAGTPLRIASKKRKSKKITSEAAEVEVSDPKPKKPKKAKKEKVVPQENIVGPAIPTVQEKFKDLEPVKILDKRTGGGTSVGSSKVLSDHPQPKIPKKIRCVRKMKVSDYVLQEDAEVEAATDLVTRMEWNKKVTAEQAAYLLDKV
ncbi:hypothetical protein MtrunA17_Chr3g0092441 [Medicago truncatula]|nr:hypothetical protein MtrunA17_Chr3g0092441 [Medicago truncatula]